MSPEACGRDPFSENPWFWWSWPGVLVRYCVDYSSVGVCLMFISQTDWGFRNWGGRSHWYHIMSRVHILNVIYHCWCWPWLRQCLSSFSLIKLPFLPFPYCILWEEVIVCSLHLGVCSRELCLKVLPIPLFSTFYILHTIKILSFFPPLDCNLFHGKNHGLFV